MLRVLRTIFRVGTYSYYCSYRAATALSQLTAYTLLKYIFCWSQWPVALSAVCCQVEVSATGWSFVQRSPTDCGVSECDTETSRMRRPTFTGGCWTMVKWKETFWCPYICSIMTTFLCQYIYQNYLQKCSHSQYQSWPSLLQQFTIH